CPHGNPIPRDGQTAERPPGIRLSQARSGSEVTILRVTEEAEEDARLLTFLQQHGIRPGSVFAIDEVAEHLGTMRLHRTDDGGGGLGDGRSPPGETVTLALVAAAKLRVVPGRAAASLFPR